MAASLQQPFFGGQYIHTFTLVLTSLQRPPLYNGLFLPVRKVAVVESLNCMSNFHIINLNNIKAKN